MRICILSGHGTNASTQMRALLTDRACRRSNKPTEEREIIDLFGVMVARSVRN
jgi:hypothetical protein